MSAVGKLFLLPTPLGENAPMEVIPIYNTEIIRGLRIFVVEQLRTARRFLRKIDPQFPIDEAIFVELNEHTIENFDYNAVIQYLLKGKDVGLLSEAGLPCVADPGNAMVALAHEKNIEVCPLVGPSSLMLALMASGMNGQNFVFHGYLPREKDKLKEKIVAMENISIKYHQTQIFIEAPYRNVQLFDLLLNTCRPDTLLCIATNISLETQTIKTLSVSQWKKYKNIDIHKKPTVFILG